MKKVELRIAVEGFSDLEKAGLRWYLRTEQRIRLVEDRATADFLLVPDGEKIVVEEKEESGVTVLAVSKSRLTEEELMKLLRPYLEEEQSESEPLSAREQEVLGLLARGLSNKEVADRLFISLNTAITHRRNLTAKLGIKSLAGLSLYAYLHEMI